MKLYLLRHGETEENKGRIIQGQQPGKLTALGHQQARAAARRLQTEHFDVIFSSDLHRVIETARYFLPHNGRMACYARELRERAFGIFEGDSVDDYYAALAASGLPRPEYRPPGGETLPELANRIGAFVDNLHEHYANASVLLCTHGGTIATLFHRLLHIARDDRFVILPDNCSVSVIEFDRERQITYMELNSTAHLTVGDSPSK